MKFTLIININFQCTPSPRAFRLYSSIVGVHGFIPWFYVLIGKYAQSSSPADFDHFAERIRISNAVVY